jgi:phosphopantothenoylcysteine decarboxylase/phosphopantothenate--cysteine ligase
VAPISLAERKILLGVTGSIACFKVVEWLRLLRGEGAKVSVVMTEAAQRFVTPLTFAALSGSRVYTHMFDEQGAETIPHISLARDCDLILIAPATAQTMARLAQGLADDLLAAVTLASKARVIVCPAMNSNMYSHPATLANIERLKSFGYLVIEPECGKMACGEEGPGRLVQWETARDIVLSCMAPQDLAGQQIIVTAGPTREPIDPARFLSNRSSGKMGYALARTAKMRGAEVTLISGPSPLQEPTGVKVIHVTTASQMLDAVMRLREKATIIVKAAAVSDFRAKETSSRKIKKQHTRLHLELEQNTDILAALGDLKKSPDCPPLLVGFAAESHNIVEEGLLKLQSKNLDLLAVNDISRKDSGFEADTNRVILLDRDGGQVELPLLSKEECAHRIWDRVKKFIS